MKQIREIKFRAWDLQEKRYLSQKEMTEIGGFYYNYGVEPETDEFVLEQFTGLSDKNGVEIYEGDILEERNFLNEVIARYVVVYELNGFRYKKDVESPDSYYANGERITVIGNIHQHPELLPQ